METFGSGFTKIPAKGGYSNGDMTVIYFIVDRFQISKMTDIIHEIDPNAFVTISEVADVFKSNIGNLLTTSPFLRGALQR
jgi:uncharacterized membrane-anchored protein YitT (DUF2179 family)